MTQPGVNYFTLTSILHCNTSGNLMFFSRKDERRRGGFALPQAVRLNIYGTY